MELVTRERKPTGRPRICEATRDLVVRLYNEDEMTCREIAEACGISESSMYQILRERRRISEQEETDT